MPKLTKEWAEPITPDSIAIYREGGTAEDNVYTSFADAVTALNNVQGGGRLIVDNALGSPQCNTAVDMTDIVLDATNPNTELTLDTGAVVTNPGTIGSFLTLKNVAATTPITIPAGSHYLQAGVNCGMYADAGAAPVVDVSDGAYFFVIGGYAFTIGNGTDATVNLGDGSILILSPTGGDFILDDESLSSAFGTSRIVLGANAPAARYSRTHAGYAGTYGLSGDGDGTAGIFNKVEDAPTSPHTVALTTRFVNVAAGGGAPFVLNLPPKDDLEEGTILTVKDSTGGAGVDQIDVTPDGTDTIDDVNAPVTINTASGFLNLYRGGTGWYVFG